MRLPSINPISLGFGATTAPYSLSSPHEGVDFIPANDPTVYAPCDGKAILVPNNGNDGNGFYFYDPAGNFHGLLHNDHYLVNNGAQFKEGQPIAVMGWTGYVVPASPAGTHCHWCVKQNNVFINPLDLVGGKGGDNNMATNEQIDQWISLFHQEAYGSAPTDQIFNDWRPVLKNNFVDGSLSIMQGTDTNAGALKNQSQGSGEYIQVTDVLYRKK